MSLPSVNDAAVAGARVAADGHHQGRLAGPVGADQGDYFAGVDVQVDAAERHDLAVEGGHAAHLEQGVIGIGHHGVSAVSEGLV